ncbi:Putative ribosome biogenesis GTPase RsgA [Symmachiella dynata]|uniref:Small ribosomal subunit biogenesis GTPase RsgA n=1 Tax=Symmachiella dynata TaxID=2527995 RepID=A0A517ZT68_9PLAN|nr:ribosome small subunit-dependent GTPase A [Symmachiella dynata]QDU45669.1 Putative ribosome biogenesis GTPase RsgA [Symmachiella dynata]
MGKRKQKIRVALRKNRQKKPRRQNDFTHEDLEDSNLAHGERVSGKGDLTRHRTIIGVEGDENSGLTIDVDMSQCRPGRVLSVHRSGFIVQADGGERYECVVRNVVRAIASDQRTAVVAGDQVMFQPTVNEQGVIERVEPRTSTLSREVRGQEHVLVANVDQVLIVASSADPPLKPSLLDRYLVSAAVGDIAPLICINKADLSNLAALQPIIGLYSQLGYKVVTTSTVSGYGIPRLRELLRDRETVLTGQSGVGKSSLLNALQPGLKLRTGEVSGDSRKGKHTTTSANLLELNFGGWVVDTPGVRQFGLWDTFPEEVEGYFVEFHPFVRNCRYPDCTHTHETDCGIKQAVARGLISECRFESYQRITAGDLV